MGLTRRQALAGAAGAVAGAAGIYALVDRHTRRARPRPPAPSTLPPEQHLLDGVQVVTDNGVEVLVPPLHHAVVTAKVATDDLAEARERPRGRARGPRVALPGDARRARRSRSPGACRTSGARPRPVGAAAAGRRPGADSRRCSTRSASRATRTTPSSSRTTSRSSSAATACDAIAAAEKALFDDLGVFDEDDRPPRVRRRRAAEQARASRPASPAPT